MTQTVSKRSSSAAVHYGFTLAKRNMKYSILVLCMSLLGLPLSLIAALAECSSNSNDYSYLSEYVDEIYQLTALISAVIVIFLGAYIAMNSFAHLYDKRFSDMEYSLPMTTEKRYISGYLSGLAVYILPYILSQLVSVILMVVGINTIDVKRDSDPFAEYIPYCKAMIVGGLIVMVMFYTLFVLTMCFCGTKFESGIYGAAANLFMPMLFVCIYQIMDKYGYGLVYDVIEDTFLNRLFSFTSPIGVLYKIYVLVMYPQTIIYVGEPPAKEQYPFFSINSMEGWALECLLFIGLLFVCGLLLYRRRKAEQTGEAFISKPIFYAAMFSIMAAVCLLMDYMRTGTAPKIIVTMAVFVIIDCVINKGTKKLLQSFVKYAAVMAGIGAVYFVSVKAMDAFVVNSVPEPSEIAYAEVMGYDRYLVGNGEYVGEYHFEDEENIRRITELHAEQLSFHDDYAAAVLPAEWFGIRYTYKNGRTMERQYSEPYSSVYEELTRLEYTDEVKKQKIEALTNTLNNYDYTLVIFCGATEENIRLEPENNKDIFTDEFTAGLLDCLTEDILAMTSEDCEGYEEDSYYVNIYANYSEIDSLIENGPAYMCYTITGNHKKAIGYLDSQGILSEDIMAGVSEAANDIAETMNS